MSWYLPYSFELDDAFEDGYDDFFEGYSYYDNPYDDHDYDLACEWEEGWLDASCDYRYL